MIVGKKNLYVFTIGFDKKNPEHLEVVENPSHFYKDFGGVHLTMAEEVVMWGSLSEYVVLSRGLAAFAAQ